MILILISNIEYEAYIRTDGVAVCHLFKPEVEGSISHKKASRVRVKKVWFRVREARREGLRTPISALHLPSP